MRLLGLDFETTGLDTQNDRIIEIGAVIWDSDKRKPLMMENILVHDNTYPELEEVITRVTGLEDCDLFEFGVAPLLAFLRLNSMAKMDIAYVLAHNGNAFDKPILESELESAGIYNSKILELPWLDSRLDIPYDEPPQSNKLNHLSGDVGFTNPFKHRAIFDVLTMLKYFFECNAEEAMRALAKVNLEKAIAYSKIPNIVVRAGVSFNKKDLAKAQSFRWQTIGNKEYPKQWVKQIKENEFDELEKACDETGFKIIKLEG